MVSAKTISELIVRLDWTSDFPLKTSYLAASRHSAASEAFFFSDRTAGTTRTAVSIGGAPGIQGPLVAPLIRARSGRSVKIQNGGGQPWCCLDGFLSLLGARRHAGLRPPDHRNDPAYPSRKPEQRSGVVPPRPHPGCACSGLYPGRSRTGACPRARPKQVWKRPTWPRPIT
jgi:hypothetical protein